MWPGDWDDEPGSAAGDWPVRLLGTEPYGRVGQVIEVTAASTGKPFMARIIGRDATYTWKREWLKPKREFPAVSANPAAIVRLVLPVTSLGKLPAALEIRWGPATGGTYMNQSTGQSGRLCAYRGFFILDAAGFRQVQDRHVAWLIDENIIVPGPPKRPPDMRARIRFDEEV